MIHKKEIAITKQYKSSESIFTSENTYLFVFTTVMIISAIYLLHENTDPTSERKRRDLLDSLGLSPPNSTEIALCERAVNTKDTDILLKNPNLNLILQELIKRSFSFTAPIGDITLKFMNIDDSYLAPFLKANSETITRLLPF